MSKNNRLLMSLVIAGISALSVSPHLLADTLENRSDQKDLNTDVINVSQFKNDYQGILSEEEIKDLNAQLGLMLQKKESLMKISEGIQSIALHYSDDAEGLNLVESALQELGFGSNSADSARIIHQGARSGASELRYSEFFDGCHAACHGACHSACHGSRGWR